MKDLERRLARLEEQRRITIDRSTNDLSITELGRRLGFILAQGAALKEQGLQTPFSALAQRIARLLAGHSGVGANLSESQGEAPGALTVVASAVVPPAAGPAPDGLHPYIYITAGVRERSGERAWLVMSGSMIQRTFHGDNAQRDARDWVVEKFKARPYAEIENQLEDEYQTQLKEERV